MTDLGDRGAVRRRNADALRAGVERQRMLGAIMDLKQGREWIADILERTHVNVISYASDPYATAFREGERNIGLYILADITAYCPEQYALMLREQGEQNVKQRVTEPRVEPGWEGITGGTSTLEE